MGSTSFGQWLRQRRKALGLSQAELALRANCSFETIRKAESGQRRPSEYLAKALAQALKIAPEEVPAFIEFSRQGLAVTPTITVGTTGILSAPPQHLSRSNLPALLTSFVGRETQVAQVQALLSDGDVRLVTLLGPPGIGKTRLSFEVAAKLRSSFPDGVCFVGLSSLSAPEMVAEAIVRALDLAAPPHRAPEELLPEYLRDKKLLLLLDNFEHLAPAGRLVGTLIQTCPDLKMLVTSRIALGLYAERLFPVPPLGLPQKNEQLSVEELAQCEAVALFTQRARAVKPFFVLTPQVAPVVSEICRQLDGLPLAIELAAVRSKLLSPPELLTHLTSRLKLLTGGPADLPPRQRTLRGAIAWSYDMLEAADQALFRRIAVFMRGATLDAITAICTLPDDQPTDLLTGLTSLLDKSLLYSEEPPEGATRYWMFWTIREYGLERLAEAGEEAMVRQQHAAYYLALAETAEPALQSAARDPWLTRLDLELFNLREALAWCLGHPERTDWGLRLVGALHWFWYFRGYLSEGRDWVEKMLAQAGPWRRTALGAKALNAAGRLAWLQTDHATMVHRLEESVAIWREVGDPQGLAYALTNLGFAIVYSSREASAGGQVLIDEALSLFKAVKDKWGLAFALDCRGDVSGLLGGGEREISFYKEQSLAVYRELGDQWGIAGELLELGHIALRLNDYEAAQGKLEEARDLMHTVGDKWSIAATTRSLGDVAWHRGAYAQAQSLYQESLALYRELGDPQLIVVALRSLGRSRQDQADYAGALAAFKESLLMASRSGLVDTVAVSLAALGGVAMAQGHPGRATRLFGSAAALREASHGLIGPIDQLNYQQNLAAAQRQLDQAAFARAWEQGSGMSLEQAVAYACDGLDIWYDLDEANGMGSASGAPSLLTGRDAAMDHT
jgi:predicted ATPase/transcriptional regulator with XRE-family HTH domain